MSDRACHATPAKDVLLELESAPDGLSAADAEARLRRFGPNALPQAGGPSPRGCSSTSSARR